MKCNIIKNVLTDARVVAENPYIPRYCREDINKLSAYLEDWIKEFKEFLRDHRSQDLISLYVEKEYIDICSECKEKWEEYKDEDGTVTCANCGAELEKRE